MRKRKRRKRRFGRVKCYVNASLTTYCGEQIISLQIKSNSKYQKYY
jgi:hypothetical protein